MIDLRGYQGQALVDIDDAWMRGHRNVLWAGPTGCGKTVIFSEALRRNAGPSCAVAHRQELVGQIALALAKDGVRHNIIAPDKVIRAITMQQIAVLGRSYYDYTAQCAVAGVDTLRLRAEKLRRWGAGVTLWVQDEAHHLLPDNKWGAALQIFPNARGLGVTATPERADGRGLDVSFHVLIEGPKMGWLIEHKYLLPYRIIVALSDLDVTSLKTGRDGDYSRPSMAEASHKSHIVGDVVGEYLKHARGIPGLTFVTDVETANHQADAYNAAGVPAVSLNAKTKSKVRADATRRFECGDLLQLVNVDLFGEGYDVPRCGVISIARPTKSLPLHMQMMGRPLRVPLNGSLTPAIILDHVGNITAPGLGLPDKARTWSLCGKPKNERDPLEVPLTHCPECGRPYERIYPACPFEDCGYKSEPAGRSLPEHVDGDLVELDAMTLEAMRGEIARIDRDPKAIYRGMKHAHAPLGAARGAAKNHARRREAQQILRRMLARWGSRRRLAGDSDQVAMRRFYHRYGVDVGTAQTLGRKDAHELACRMLGEI